MRTPLLLLSIALLAFALPARADTPDGGGQLTRPPSVKRFVQALYPPEAVRDRLDGRVTLQVDISEKGSVSQAIVLQPAGHGFDEAALAAVREFEFEPAEIDGKPAPVRITYGYEFVFKPPEPPSVDGGADGGAESAGRADEAVQAAKEGPVNFSGLLLERGSRKPLVGAQVVIGDGERTEISDSEGRFAFRDVPNGEIRVTVVQTAYKRFETTESIAAGKETQVKYYVQKEFFSQFETVVRGKKEKKEVSQQTITLEEVQKIPGTQGDTLKVIQNLPGVARPAFNGGAIVIRGNSANDSGVFLDGMRIPLLYHFGGLTSVYNSDLLESVSYLPGNYSSFYGNLAGGVIDVKSRAPRKDRFGGYANISVLESSLLLEGPITDDISFAIAGRRSYIDFVLGAAPAGAIPNFQVAPRYWDAQAKLEWRINKNHTLSLLGIASNDRLTLVFERPSDADPNAAGSFNLETGFMQARLKHTYKNGNLRAETIGLVGRTAVIVQVASSAGLEIRSNEFNLRHTLEYEFSPMLTLAAGADEVFQPANIKANLATNGGNGGANGPPTGPSAEDSTARQVKLDQDFKQYYPSLWAEARIRLFDRWLIVPGIRHESYVFTEATSNKRSTNPRLGTRFELNKEFTFKGGIGMYSGAPVQGEPTKTFGNPDIRPKVAYQASLGGEWRPEFYSALNLSIEGFYNRLDDLIVNNPDLLSVARGGPIVTNDGIGRSYGAEFLLRHQLTDRFFGWLSYTLSRSERLDGPGKPWRLFDNDQTHVLTAIASYRLPWDINVGARFRYATGNPYTPVIGARRNDLTDSFSPIFGAQNSQRLRSFNQLDLRIDKTFVFDVWSLNVFLDVTNAYNNASVEGTTYSYDYSQSAFFTGLPILPIVGVKGSF